MVCKIEAKLKEPATWLALYNKYKIFGLASQVASV